MTRLLIALVLTAVAVQEPTGILRIDAVAFDRSGNPVTDLQRDDLEVWINGYRIPIESVTAVTPATEDRGGRLIVLLLDDVTVTMAALPRVKEVARRFVSRMLPGDRMAVMLLHGGAAEITDEPARLMKRIDNYNRTAGIVLPDRIGADLLNTIAGVSRDILEAPERRKLIVAIGSGWLLDAPIPPPQFGLEVRREWLEAVRTMAVADIHFYVIDPGGVGASRPRSTSDSFARDAGGHAFVNTNDLRGAVDRILREAGHYYEIHVTDPPIGLKAPIRELDVRSLRRGVTVRARRTIPGRSPEL